MVHRGIAGDIPIYIKFVSDPSLQKTPILTDFACRLKFCRDTVRCAGLSATAELLVLRTFVHCE